MDPSTNVCITPKGTEELKSRTYKVGMKKRSVLICLERPHTIESLVSRSVFPPSEIIAEIQSLAQEGFVSLTTAGGPQPVVEAAATGHRFRLEDDIVLPEAKFLMIDFWIDCFGPEPEAFTDMIQACENIEELGSCLDKIVVSVEKQCPQQMPALNNLIKEINATA